MNKKLLLTAALALCLSLTACAEKAPSLDEVEAAIRDGSVTMEDALDKGWITQEWADSYLEENSVPAADKVAVNMVGEFTTETAAGEAFTNQDLPPVAFVAFLDPEDEGAAEFYQALVDADKLAALEVRSRLPGDVVQLAGKQGHKKLKKIFIDKKVPAAERSQLPLVVSDGKIVWIPGYFLADCVKITEETKRFCILQYVCS